ncbi:MAG TPA: crosslink repair DNA glycosylase YcaQ family protein [Polyangiales bacterium]|nr:crosslink repair DNA glycosylase YcaQ family protein [Polyangiales bacterium]
MLRRRSLAAHAIAHTFFTPRPLARAIRQLGFVQADPIRAPARAQDLILRQRVPGYRAGDLERHYASLEIEEDYLYAYGFLPRESGLLLHPRALTARLLKLDKSVLEAVREAGVVHPRLLDEQFGVKRQRNAWGGFSRATKRSLERLHHRGLVRVARREQGVRLYEVTPASAAMHDPDARLRGLMRVVANVLAPVSESTLRSIVTRVRRWMPRAAPAKQQLEALLQDGELVRDTLDDVSYLWPAASAPAEVPRVVRLLAPFDPLVWDRPRFEQLFGWAYRFEAYTPLAKRVRGYYALPLLWGERVVGWANAQRGPSGLKLELGFQDRRPRERDFTRELDAEIERLRAFLEP